MMDCLVCGAQAVITPRLFPEADDRWDCTVCPSWGTISERKDEPKPDETDADEQEVC